MIHSFNNSKTTKQYVTSVGMTITNFTKLWVLQSTFDGLYHLIHKFRHICRVVFKCCSKCVFIIVRLIIDIC